MLPLAGLAGIAVASSAVKDIASWYQAHHAQKAQQAAAAAGASQQKAASVTSIPDARGSFQSHLESAASKFIQDRDANKDGVLSFQELGASREKFDMLDLNRDGRIDQTEMVKANMSAGTKA